MNPPPSPSVPPPAKGGIKILPLGGVRPQGREGGVLPSGGVRPQGREGGVLPFGSGGKKKVAMPPE